MRSVEVGSDKLPIAKSEKRDGRDAEEEPSCPGSCNFQNWAILSAMDRILSSDIFVNQSKRGSPRAVAHYRPNWVDGGRDDLEKVSTQCPKPPVANSAPKNAKRSSQKALNRLPLMMVTNSMRSYFSFKAGGIRGLRRIAINIKSSHTMSAGNGNGRRRALPVLCISLVARYQVMAINKHHRLAMPTMIRRAT